MGKRYIDADEFVKRVIQYPRQSTRTIGLALADTPTADVVDKERYDRLLENATIMDEALDEYQTADVPERHVGKWIPVTERLPERYGRFIVTIVPDAWELWKTIELVMYSDLMGLVKTPVFWSGNVFKSDFEDVTSKVTAWMPLPKPYRKEGDAE